MFIDANIFLYSVYSTSQTRRCQAFLRKVDSGEQNAITSVMVMDEVLFNMMKRMSFEDSERVVQKFLTISHLQVVAVTPENFIDSLSFVRQGLDPHDALHAAVMKAQGVSTILSYDKDFDKIKSVKRQEP